MKTAGCIAAIIVSIIVLVQLRPYSMSAELPERIQEGIIIHSVSVGGMTHEEAAAALQQRFSTAMQGQSITYICECHDTPVTHTFADFGAQLVFDAAIEAALQASSRRRIPRRMRSVETAPTLAYNSDKMDAVLQNIAAAFETPAVNAAFSVANGQFATHPETTGAAINRDDVLQNTLEILQTLQSGEILVATSVTRPTYTLADMDFKKSALAYYETYAYGSAADPRFRNVTRAAGRINNAIVYPGETFSAGRIIGAHLPDSGYEAAIVLVRGRTVEDIGGGVCQVVSTLYNAVLRAELTIVQRNNHSVRVSYVEPGFDATVAGEYYDLKFKNCTPHPLVVTAGVSGNTLRIGIYGYEARTPGRSIRFEAALLELIEPEPCQEIIDDTLPPGTRQIIQEPQQGYRISVVKHVYMNGTPVEQILVSESTYRALAGVVAIAAE